MMQPRGEPGPFRSKPGDTRWQSVPFMAHRHYGPTYKWMLLGDDDTLWFMHGGVRGEGWTRPGPRA